MNETANSVDVVLPFRDRIIFRGRVNQHALMLAIKANANVQASGYKEVLLDFSAVSKVYADSMLGLAAVVESGRRDGIHYNVSLPEVAYLQRLFMNSNWAHLLSPKQFPLVPNPESGLGLHLSATAFSNAREQTAIVDRVLEVVMRSMVGSSESILAALEWSLNEITDNVLNHSNAGVGGIAQAITYSEKKRVEFVVSDAGAGIPTTLRTAFPAERADKDLLMRAVQAGVTRDTAIGQGNGLAGTLSIASATGGSLRIVSGRGELDAYLPVGERQFVTRSRTRGADVVFPGTLVQVVLETSERIDIGDVLRLGREERYEPWSFVDQNYVDDNDRVVLRVASHDLGFGSREAGRAMRIKIENLLGVASERGWQRVYLDWQGVRLISSSFADEAIGKLCAQMGTDVLLERVTHVNLEPIVRSLIDRAVAQRLQWARG
jgi:hypothetical protein